MKKSTYLFSIVLLFLFGWMACQQQPKTVPPAPANFSKLLRDACEQYAAQKKFEPPTSGFEWKYEHAKLCFEEYDSVMARHGYVHDPAIIQDEVMRKPRSYFVPKSSLITRSEAFLGTDMVCWLVNHTDLETDTADGVTELRMGMYTAEFFAKADPDCKRISKDSQDAKVGRMTVFIVPDMKARTKLGKDPTVYDFGGLQP